MKIAHKRLKGISPLLAAVFLIMIAAVAVPMFSGWFTSLLRSTTNSAGNTTEQSIKCNAAGIAIEDFYLDFSAGMARANVRNSGQVPEQIASAKVYAANGSEAANLTQFPLNISSGEYKYISFSTEGAIASCSNFSYAIVSGRCGSARFEGLPKGC